MHLADGIRLTYDVLAVATGAVLLPGETEVLTGQGWGEGVHTFYDLRGAAGLRRALERFDGGRVVIDVADLPVKCPVVPLEFAFLTDWYFQRRGIRDKARLIHVTPLDAAFTKPVAAKALGGLLEDKGIDLVTEFTLGEVDGAGGRLVSYDEREVPFDLAVVVPLHGGAQYVGRSEGLGDELGVVPVDPRRAVAGRLLRRTREPFCGDRLPQGSIDRLQLRHRAASRPLPGRRRTAPA